MVYFKVISLLDTVTKPTHAYKPLRVSYTTL
jgi:hypothetical protein